jgi:manganese/iron transport system substrate-binding protein
LERIHHRGTENTEKTFKAKKSFGFSLRPLYLCGEIFGSTQMKLNMKKLRNILLQILIILSLALAGCRPTASSSKGGDGLRVTAIETFLADIAQNVAGSRAKIDALIPIGVDPHSFEPTPQDIVKLAQAQVIIANGAGFETWLQKTIDTTGEKAQVIEAASGLKPRTAREGEAAEMSAADLVDSICTAGTPNSAQAAAGGPDAGHPAALPAETGYFSLKLSPARDGSFGATLKYATDASGDIQVALGAGKLAVMRAADGSPVPVNKQLPLTCHGLTQGNILTLQKNTIYVLALSGFASAETSLVIGPAGGVEHHDTDPHFWLDPNNAILYVETIRAGLTQTDPAGADVYTRNAADYITRLKQLDAWIQQQVATIAPERRLLVTNHESFGYFADRYGFQIVGTIVPSVSSDASPSAQQLARLVDRIRASHAIAIFLETGTNPQLAEEVGRETGVKVVTDLYTHSISATNGSAPTYIDMMKFDVNAIVTALK